MRKKNKTLCSRQSHPALFNYGAHSIKFMLLTQWEHIKIYWIKGHEDPLACAKSFVVNLKGTCSLQLSAILDNVYLLTS